MLSLAEENEMLRAENLQLRRSIEARRVPGYLHPLGIRSSHLQQMFSLLVRHELLTREVFFQAVYGNEVDPPDPKISDVMMHNLRKHCDEHGIEIETVRGIGWRLTAESRAKLSELGA